MRLKILRATSVQAVEFIKPYLLPDDDVPAEVFVEQIQANLKNPAFLFLMAFDEDQPDEVSAFIGFVIAFAPPRVGYVQVSQVHIVKNIPGLHVVDSFYMYVSGFAESLRRFELRMETERDPRGFTKKYGFEPVSISMRKQINTDLDTVIAKRISDLSQGVQHEQGRPEDGEFVDEKSTGDQQSDRGVSGSGSDGAVQSTSTGAAEQFEDYSGSDAVSGQSRGRAGSTVQPGEQPDLAELVEQIRERKRVGGE